MTEIKVLGRSYKCFYKNCRLNRQEGRILEKDLVKSIEEDDHIDYRCPCCDSVIICVKIEKIK